MHCWYQKAKSLGSYIRGINVSHNSKINSLEINLKQAALLCSLNSEVYKLFRTLDILIGVSKSLKIVTLDLLSSKRPAPLQDGPHRSGRKW